MNCQEAIDIMEDAMEGRLHPASRAGFEEHVAGCAPCGNYFEQLRLTRRALQTLPREGRTSPQREKLVELFKKEFELEQD